MTASVSPADLRTMLMDGEELALVDVREQGVFYKGHLFHAACIPASRLEIEVADLIPRRDTRIVLCDGGDAGNDTGGEAGSEAGDGLAAACARKLGAFGYAHLQILEGGVEGWVRTGVELFGGINVPSKAFGEFVEHAYETPRIEAAELKRLINEGADMVILDSRPEAEYRRMHIPGGIDAPGAELVWRVAEVAPDPDTLVVVNCAGRTRSIIGAQSLINAGIPNRVVALKDGTMGWELAGFACERDEMRFAPSPSAATVATARDGAAAVARRFGVRTVDRATVEDWHRGVDRRTTYVLDVRTAEEFEAGHLPGSRHAPGGQLVQATDEYMAVRNARVVLVDSEMVRAVMTASWLIQLGWPDVRVLEGGLGDAGNGGDAGSRNETGPRPPVLLGLPDPDRVNLKALMRGIVAGQSLAILDLGSSLDYRAGHLPGAWWGVRSRLDAALAQLPAVETLVLTSPDGLVARYAVPEAAALRPETEVLVLEGGTRGWIDAGLPVRGGMERPTTETDDVWYKPYDHESDVERHMQAYLDWEVALVDQIRRDPTITFRRFD